MKRFNLLMIAVLALFAMCGVAQAERLLNGHTATPILKNYSGYASTARYSAVFRGSPNNTRSTVFFYGYSTAAANKTTPASDAASLSGSSMNGTAALQCAPTITGPFTNVKAHEGTAVSTTSNAVYDLDTWCNFYRAAWTRGNVSATHNITIYLLTGE